MVPPRSPTRSPSTRRPLLGRGEGKRALVNVGGAVETWGDASVAEGLRRALTVQASERDATLTHPFHAYPARLHPEVTRGLLRALAPAPRATVLDPFCGSGTVLIESLVMGHNAVGRDLSPFATELARLKTLRTTEVERKSLHATAKRLASIAQSRAREVDPKLAPRGEASWFRRHTLAELVSLRMLIDAQPEGVVKLGLRMLLSSVLVKVSLQASETDARRVEKDVRPGLATHLFAWKADELVRCLAALAKVLHAQPAPRPTVDIATDDAQSLATVPDGSVDVVVSSPPYANTYDYVDHHARRYAWLGIDAEGMRAREMGAARWFATPASGATRFQAELDALAASLSRVLKPGARAALVIADGAAAGQRLAAERMVTDAAHAARLTVLARASQTRKVFDHDSVEAFQRAPKREHVIVLERAVQHPSSVVTR